MKAQPWTSAHRVEAWQHLCEGLRAGLPADLLSSPLTLTEDDIATEEGFRRAWVRFIDIDNNDRPVRRVRGLAEGRLVRHQGYRAGLNFYTLDQREQAIAYGKSESFPVRRSTRIRRAP